MHLFPRFSLEFESHRKSMTQSLLPFLDASRHLVANTCQLVLLFIAALVAVDLLCHVTWMFMTRCATSQLSHQVSKDLHYRLLIPFLTDFVLFRCDTFMKWWRSPHNLQWRHASADVTLSLHSWRYPVFYSELNVVVVVFESLLKCCCFFHFLFITIWSQPSNTL